jgi:hypothetical protein
MAYCLATGVEIRLYSTIIGKQASNETGTFRPASREMSAVRQLTIG